MKSLMMAMLMGCLVLPGCGGEQPPAEPATESEAATETAPAPDKPSESASHAAPDGEAVPDAAAVKLIGEMVRAYQAAPTMTDRITVELLMGGQASPQQEHRIALGRGRDVQIVAAQNEITVVHGKVYVVLPQSPDRYVQVELVEDLLTTCKEVFGTAGGLGSVNCALRYGKPFEEIIAAFAIGLPGEPRVSSYRVVTDNDGRELEQMTLIAGAGHAVVSVDAQTKFLTTIEKEKSPGGGPGGFVMSQRLTFHPQVHDELPEPISFDVGDRMRVESIEELRGRAEDGRRPAKLRVQPGQAAPDFTLYTLAGERVTLSELTGSVVVLDFWATWCTPCRRGLPMLQEFADWAASSGLSVKVYAVNMGERAPTNEAKWEKAHEFWEQQQFTMPSLIDLDGKVPMRYGVTVIPTTVVIDPAGRIHSAHSGLDPDMIESLKEAATSLSKPEG